MAQDRVTITTNNPYVKIDDILATTLSQTTYAVAKDTLTVDDLKQVVQAFKEEKTNPQVTAPVEEWVWVTGYKGTRKDMKCRDYQYEMGKLHTMPEDANIVDCESGFHLCLNMNDVRKYYDIGSGNRYFEVQALVRKSHVDKYGQADYDLGTYWYSLCSSVRDKLSAKSIIFTRELTNDEILKDTEASGWSDTDKRLAIEIGIPETRCKIQARELATLGYSEAFSQYIAERGKYEEAKQVASQKDLSMDMKVLCIIRGLD